MKNTFAHRPHGDMELHVRVTYRDGHVEDGTIPNDLLPVGTQPRFYYRRKGGRRTEIVKADCRQLAGVQVLGVLGCN